MSLTNYFSFPYKGMEYNSFPNYSITNVPIITYVLIGITTLTLGYVTMKDKESENSSSSESSSDNSNKTNETKETELTKEGGNGRKLNKKMNKTKKTNLTKSKSNKK